MASSSEQFQSRHGDAAGVNRTEGEIVIMHLDHDLAIVREARRRLRCWLDDRGHTNADDATLVLSELVTNAIVHGGAGCTVEMQHRDDLLQIDVRDPSAAAPVIRSVRPDDIGGRGLQVVDMIAKAWGWEPTDDGKRVWARLVSTAMSCSP